MTIKKSLRGRIRLVLLLGRVLIFTCFACSAAEFITNQPTSVPEVSQIINSAPSAGSGSWFKWDSILTPLLTGIAGFVLAYWKFISDLRAEYDKDLRRERLTVYKKLLALMSKLPKYPHSIRMRYRDVHEFSLRLQDWYFIESGGLFLSGGPAGSREAYFDLQDGCRILLTKAKGIWAFDAMKNSGKTLRDYLGRADRWKPKEEVNRLSNLKLDHVDDWNSFILDEATTDLRKLASNLRTSLTKDVLTRKGSALGG